MSNYGENLNPYCPYSGECYHRTAEGDCDALTSIDFHDGLCHFQKAKEGGQNMYDAGLNRNGISKAVNRKRMIKALFNLGYDVSEIASRCGTTQSTVYRHLKLMRLQR